MKLSIRIKTSFILGFAVLFSSTTLFSQTSATNFQCGADEVHRKLMENNPVYRQKIIDNEEQIQQIIKSSKKGKPNDKTPGVHNVCVVVHVVHLGEPVGTGTNISDAQIQSAITALTDDFRRVGQGSNTHPDGADVEIEFNLAVQDPFGNPTTGINRVNGTTVADYAANGITTANDPAVKALSIWPNTDYYNIWVVSEIKGNNAGAGTQGYAYYPGAPANIDGTVIVFNAFGTVGNLKGFTNLNRTITHELGHAFNLYHTFKGGATVGSCGVGSDLVCDTPPTDVGNTCATVVTPGAQFENYMDYSGEACKNMFTNDQKARMRAALHGPRASLLNSTGCIPPAPPVTDFKTLPNNGETCVGAQIQFTDSSSNKPSSWSWSFSGGTPNTSTSENPVITYNTPGIYAVTLIASNSLGAGNPVTKNGYVTVITGPTDNGSTITDAKCFGGFDGSIDLTVSGSNTPFSYLWNTGAFTEDLSGLGAGTYNVTVTNSKGCKIVLPFDVKEPIKLTVVSQKTDNSSACSTCDGTATVILSGGTGPYSYLWSDGQNTQTATALCKGNYTCDVTDANGCTVKTSATVGGLTSFFTAIQGTDLSCFKVCNGSADLNVQGGSAPYSYEWSGGQLTEDVSSLCAGNYSVTVTDGAGCVSVANVVINQPDSLELNAVFTPPACGGGCDGTADANVIGGIAPYQYAWDNGPTISSQINLCAGTYNVAITDANSCVTNGQVILPNNGITVNVTGVDASCAASCNGTATATPVTGIAPYTYKWSDALTQNTATATGLCAGNYSVEVTDASGCSIITNYTVTIATPFTIDTVVTHIDCYGTSTGQVALTPNGGVTPYAYLWDDPAAQNTAIATGLSAGTYKATITDGSGCTNSISVKVNQQDSLFASLTGVNSAVTCGGGCTGQGTLVGNGGVGGYTYSWSTGANVASVNALCTGGYTGTITDSKGCAASVVLTINESDLGVTSIITDASCVGSCDGFMDLAVTGGLAPYNYVWSNSGPDQDYQMNLCEGSYSVEITDANGCKAAALGEVFAVPVVPLTVTTDSVAALCATSCDGSIKEMISGGYTPYSIAWNTGATTDSIGGLCANVYLVTITDSIGCDTTHNVTIIAPPVLNVNITGTPVLCNGVCNGTVTANVTGGTAPYLYLWDDPAAQTSPSALGLCSGNYNVTVTDANGCIATATVPYAVTEPAALSATLVATNPKCAGSCDGDIAVTPIDGVAPYIYSWNDPNNQATQIANNLCEGNWTVTVTDNNGCTTTASSLLDAPDQLQLTLIAIDESCEGVCDGNITSNVVGGTAPYVYLWDDANAQNTADASALCEGTFTLSVTDNNSCTIADAATILPGNKPLAGFIDNGNQCLTGNSFVFTNQGTTGVSYSWDFGDATNSVQENPTHTYTVSGTYTVTQTVTQNGCVDTYSKDVEVYETPTINLVATNSSCAASCTGGIELTTLTGTAPYNYQWSSGSNVEDPSNLCPGVQNVTVTDANGCIATGNINIAEPAALTLALSVPTANCGSACSSTTTATVGAGTAPYQYLWSNGQNTQVATNLCAGTIEVTITDAKGCIIKDSVNVNADTLELFFLDANDVTCNGLNDGSIFIGVHGGSPNYTYSWSNGAVTKDLTGLAPGTYTVTVTDASGCTISGSIDIIEPAVLSTDVVKKDVYCAKSLCDGEASGSFTGGIPPYVLSWSTGEQVADLINICPKDYTFTVTDGNLCKDSTTVSVLDLNKCDSLFIVAVASPDTICIGACSNLSANVSIDSVTNVYSWTSIPAGFTSAVKDPGNVCPQVTTMYIFEVTNGTDTAKDTVTVTVKPLPVIDLGVDTAICAGSNITLDAGSYVSYDWNTGDKTRTVSVSDGNYSVTVTDANGCIGVDTIVITPTTVIADAGVDQTILCIQTADLLASGNGGTAPYNYQWAGGPTTDSYNGVGAGTYTVTVTDAGGCLGTDVVDITNANSTLNLTLTNDLSICLGETASIEGVVAGNNGAVVYDWDNGLAANAGPHNVSPGVTTTYSLEVTDGAGCSITESVTVTVNDNPTVDAGIDQTVLCSQTADLLAVANNGTAPYNYQWAGGTATDSYNGVGAGTYVVTVSDGNSCTATDTVEVNNASSTLNLTLTNDVSICLEETTSIEGIVAGNNGAVVYDWDNGLTATAGPHSIKPGITTTYSLKVTDGAGCSVTESVTVMVNSNPTVDAGVDQAIACTQTANLLAAGNGGTAPYNYQWAGGPTTDAYNGVGAGSYTVTVTDAGGCLGTDTVDITNANSTLNLTLTNGLSICLGETTSIEGIVTGNNGTVVYDWDNGLAANAGPHNVSPGVTTTYSLEVTDGAGCSITESVTVTVNDNPTVDAGVDQSIACTQTGNLLAVANNGTAPYNYQWAGGPVAAVYTGVVAGTYSVIATDLNGCKATDTIEVTNGNSTLALNLDQDTTICAIQTVPLTASVTGAVGNVVYSWSNGLSNTSFHNVQPSTTTIYELTVTDDAGCSVSANVTVSITPDINIVTSANPICIGESSKISSNVAGAAPFTYLWAPAFTLDSNTIANPTATPAITTSYKLIVTDAKGCIDSANVEVIVNPNPIADFKASPGLTDISDPNIDFTDLSSNATKWLWDFGDSTNSIKLNPSHTYGDTGTYSVSLTIESPLGCVDSISKLVIIRPLHSFWAPNTFTPDGDGINEGFIPVWSGMDDTSFNMMIFDRWGEMIYETDSIAPWNGKVHNQGELVPIGSYIWKVKITDLNGAGHSYIGHVNIIK